MTTGNFGNGPYSDALNTAYTNSGFYKDENSKYNQWLQSKKKVSILADFKNSPYSKALGAFTFFACTNQTVERIADVPVTPLEDGSFASDHIIKKPATIELSGYVSNQYVSLSPIDQAVFRALEYPGRITKYLPEYSRDVVDRMNAVRLMIQNVINKADDVLNDITAFTSIFDPSNNEPPVEKFIKFMHGIFDNSVLAQITIEDRNDPYIDMAITSFSYSRDNQSDMIQFSIKAQQVVFSKIDTTSLQNLPNPQTQANKKSASTQGKKTSPSLKEQGLTSQTNFNRNVVNTREVQSTSDEFPMIMGRLFQKGQKLMKAANKKPFSILHVPSISPNLIQQFQVRLPGSDGLLYIRLEYDHLHECWIYFAAYKDMPQNQLVQRRVCVHVVMLYEMNKPFGLFFTDESNKHVDAFLPNDFTSGRIRMFILPRDAMKAYRGYDVP